MSKVSKSLKAIFAIIRNPWLLNHVLVDNDLWLKSITKKYSINSLPVVDIDTLFPNFNEELSAFSSLGGSSFPGDLMLLRALCKTIPDCKYFEIGTSRGESAVNVADVCSLCYTLDLEPGKLPNEIEVKTAAFFSKGNSKITHFNGDSLTFDYKGLHQKFDVIFIDGDHRYESVKSDTENVFKYLAHENTIVVWHDYGFDPLNVRYEVMGAILDGTPVNLHKNLYHVSNTMCAVYINKQYPTMDLASAHIPNKKFAVKIESKPL
jgi:predicted O-methyltransferase YrrM